MKGWFPRRCVKLPDRYYSSDNGGKRTLSDSKTEPNSTPKPTAEGHNDGVDKKAPSLSAAPKSQNDPHSKPLSTESKSARGSGASSGTTPTFGARKRTKKPKANKN